jgi:Skp family chaperone for outer membrane proteins
MRKQEISVLFLLFVCLMSASPSFAAEKSGGETGQKEVSQEVKEALDAIKSYSAEQRDEAAKKVKVALKDLDARIQGMEDRLEKKWGQMDQAAREKARSAMQSLRKKRNELAEWYGGMKHSSANAWEQAKKGFLDSYDSLSKAFDKAVKEF